MKKLLTLLLLATLSLSALAKNDSLNLSGRVKESFGKTDLTSAVVIVYDKDGKVRDSIPANRGMMYRDGERIPMSYFSFKVPRVDSTYVFDVICDGYTPQTVTFSVSDIGRRETTREIPFIYLERAPRMLKEITVSTSKIKFYNKGDTVVFNADAFQLAEGSMLDALIAQLPGVELSDNGQIKVNGEFVESLLLNGRDFMDGNNNLMLENIASYTVKNIEVYQGQKTRDIQTGDKNAPKVLTMDIKLKREYNIGIMLNAQAGYGTEDRYLGKIFVSSFNSTTRLSLVGNINNLNDNRKPGRNDTWTPEQMPTGTREYRSVGFDYNYKSNEEDKMAYGNISFMQSIDKTRRTTNLTNFLPGGDTYENSYDNNHDRDIRLNTRHAFSFRKNNNGYGAFVSADYSYAKNAASALSGAFSDEPLEMNADILDAIYSDGSTEQLESIINRNKTRTDSRRKSYSIDLMPFTYIGIPKTDDNIQLELNASYSSTKDELWRDNTINYGADPNPAYRLRQYLDNTPDHSLTLGAEAAYRTDYKNAGISLQYAYDFNDRVRDSYMYALDRLADMGIYGVVPQQYLSVLDPANSFTSRLFTNRHSLTPSYSLYNTFADKSALIIELRPVITLTHRKLDYYRNLKEYRLSKSNAAINISGIWSAMIEYRFNVNTDGGRQRMRNCLRYSYRIAQTLPEMTDMLDIVDDSNPLNIYLGNPDLKQQTTHRHLFRWAYTPLSHPLQNYLYLGINHSTNTLVRGYTYDSATGVRHNRMYNVDGNHNFAVTDNLSWQFGSQKQFTLSSDTDFDLAQLTDMIGVDSPQPEQTKVHNRTITEKLKLAWNFAGQSLQLRGEYTNRNTSSSQQGFRDINAHHAIYGISGIFRLPAGFGISTDFTCYTRRGYGSSYLDTTDPVWNARLSYTPPRHSRWVFMVDGFDLLHKLSTVKYAVNAAGRTVSYTNALPRYVLFSVQYRLNIQPKKH